MKKLLCTLLLLVSMPAFPCKFEAVDTPDTRAAMKQRGGYPLTDEKCAILNKNGMSLWVDAQATVLNGVNVGTAVVSVWKDGVISDAVGRGTSVNSGGVGSQDVADQRMVSAVGDAIRLLDFEKAVKEVHAYTAKLNKKR